MKIPQVNYYSLNHKEVNKRFDGELTFMNTISIEGTAWAIYKAKNPNKKKGHKKYMGLAVSQDTMLVTGFTPKEMSEYRNGIVAMCTDCNEILQSCSHHHYVTCSCDKAMIDGGDVYVRSSANPQTKILKADLLECKILK